MNQGTNLGTIIFYQDCIVHADGHKSITLSSIELNINRFNLNHFAVKDQPSLQQLLQIYFTPLQTYELLADRLYGARIVEETGCLELPLWQVRQAYLATFHWNKKIKEALQATLNKLYQESYAGTEAETFEVAIAKVLIHSIDTKHRKENLANYTGCAQSLKTLIHLVSQPSTQQHAEYLTYALSLLITLSLRHTSFTSPREQILAFLKGESVELELLCKNNTYKTLPLKLTKGKKYESVCS